MNKYEPLTAVLDQQVADEVRVSFEDMEDADIIGIELPESAKQYPAWWGNEVKAAGRQCHAWLGAGWKVSAVNLTAEYVVFKRHGG